LGRKKEEGDVLIFMGGKEEINCCCDEIGRKIGMMERDAEMNQKDPPPPFSLIPIHSQLPAELQAKIFEESPQRKMHCGDEHCRDLTHTLDGIVFGIDCGFWKQEGYWGKRVYSCRLFSRRSEKTRLSSC
jgi:pre-mRNA-splicing factor ATP-dependent RNA helicase DHX38/PRP16